MEDRIPGMTPLWNLDRRSRLSAPSGPSREAMPTMAFRLALALRRCGEAETAEALFRWSRRLAVERYVAERLAVACEGKRLERTPAAA